MNVEEREYLVKNHMMYEESDDANTSIDKFEQTVVMHAENMNDYQLGNLYSAMILSPKTRYYQKRLVEIESAIEKTWNGLVAIASAKPPACPNCEEQASWTKYKTGEMYCKCCKKDMTAVAKTWKVKPQASIKLIEQLLPPISADENLTRKYDKLSFTIKHILRATYDPASKHFEPQYIFGTYSSELGVENGAPVTEVS